MDIKERFGKAVRARREELSISQEELGHRIGADQAYVSRIEKGQMNVTLETIELITHALSSDVRKFFIDLPGETFPD